MNSTAQTHVVTSREDSGPGTLREALTKAAANGTASVDRIHFNLPGTTEADRTITLLSELPHIKSKTIIDATTQPGAEFGRSDAKVAIKCDRRAFANPYIYTAALFVDGATDVEIYGFYIYDFYDLANRFPDAPFFDAGIYVSTSENVIIGSPGKGNVLDQNEHGIYVDGDFVHNKSSRITVQSNWIGLKPDGTISEQGRSSLAIHLICNGAVVGGDTEDKGNYIGPHSGVAYEYRDVAVVFGGSNTIFRFNRLAVDLDGRPSSGTVRVNIRNINMVHNLLVADNLANTLDIFIWQVTNFSVVRNKAILQGSGGLSVWMCKNGSIGTDREEDMNISQGSYFSVGRSEQIHVRKNSVQCTREALVVRVDSGPEIAVLVNTDNEFSGTATPNSEIYIYEDKSECQSCNPHQFVTKLNADASGKWILTGDFAGKQLTANAVMQSNSSEYTIPTVDFVSGKQVDAVRPGCDRDNGSLRILSFKHVLKIEWFNEYNQKIGEGVEIKNLGPGVYYAKLYNGNCIVRLQDVHLTRLRLALVTANVAVSNPTCGQKNGAIKGVFLQSELPEKPLLEWRDKNGQPAAHGTTEPTGLGPGEYTLFVTTSGTCAVAFGPVVLENEDNPVSGFPAYPATITNAACGGSTGSVRLDLTAGLKPAGFKWVNSAGTLVSDKSDLTSVPAGTYRLFVRDKSGCEGLYNTYEIEDTPDLIIDTSAIKITPDMCGSGKGRIAGMRVLGGSGAYQYSWTDAGGKQVATTFELNASKAGKYILRVSGAGCGAAKAEFLIPDSGTVAPNPHVVDLTVCAPGRGNIKLPNANQGIHRLYLDSEGGTPLEESINGAFDVVVAKTTTFYVTYSNGVCESAMVPLTVHVTESDVNIANTISPNGDSVNDTWQIKGLDNSLSRVRVFNRWGQVVFSSQGYKTPFAGERNGAALPSGTYYYIIDLRGQCNPIRGSLFVVR